MTAPKLQFHCSRCERDLTYRIVGEEIINGYLCFEFEPCQRCEDIVADTVREEALNDARVGY
jgi:hypothetical protein